MDFYPKNPKKFRNMKLDLQLESNTYKQGDTVIGQLSVLVPEPATVLGVRITIEGRAHVEWLEQYEHNDTTHMYTCSGDDYYLKHTITVWGNPVDAPLNLPQQVIPAGQHNFDFTFPLVCNRRLPGTFEGCCWRMEYLIKAFIQRPEFIRFDEKAEKKFTVRPPVYDLNLNPRAKEPQEAHDAKDICCWWCCGGRINIFIALPKSGYANGETVPIRADIINNSGKGIVEVRISLKQIAHVRTAPQDGSNTKTSRDVAKIVKRELIREGHTRQLMESLQVPDISKAYPSFDNTECQIVSLSYEISVEVGIAACTFDFSVSAPIVVGSVPLLAAPFPGEVTKL